MKLDSSILLKKEQEAPFLFVKTLVKGNEKHKVGLYYKPILKNI